MNYRLALVLLTLVLVIGTLAVVLAITTAPLPEQTLDGATLRAEPARGNYAFVTFVCSGDAYIPGAIMVAYGLKHLQQVRQRVIVLVTPDVSAQGQKTLRKWFDEVREVPYIEMPLKTTESRFQKIYTKLNILRLTEYDKIVYIDADLFPIRNFTHLLTLPAPAANNDIMPPANLLTPPARHGERLSERETSCNLPRFAGINAGLMVLEPSEKAFQDMMRDLPNTPYHCWPEQRWITKYYSGKWTHIHPRFNYQTTAHESMGSPACVKNVFGLHFTGAGKPWQDEIKKPSKATRFWQAHYRLARQMR